MKPVTHYPLVNHRNILYASPYQGGFLLLEKINSKIREHFGTNCGKLSAPLHYA